LQQFNVLYCIASDNVYSSPHGVTPIRGAVNARDPGKISNGVVLNF